jgi:uncharacterized protein (DUF1778 family)
MDDMTDKSWTLERADCEALIAALLNPPDPNPALRAACERFQRAKPHLNSAAKLE